VMAHHAPFAICQGNSHCFAIRKHLFRQVPKRSFAHLGNLLAIQKVYPRNYGSHTDRSNLRHLGQDALKERQPRNFHLISRKSRRIYSLQRPSRLHHHLGNLCK